ncbi:SGNH/GDSL hydrolase family protein [Sporolactobacillus sp. STCC-11]|uniref:SGNH/GDSL hydrolase family protein n=1 Tax=Sporolactobacillus caesalpiniae TaxID=3230362 RepID=UPI003390D514
MMKWPYENIGVLTTRAFRNLLNKIFGDIGADMQEQKDRVDNLINGVEQPSEVVDMHLGRDGETYPVARDMVLGEIGKTESAQAQVNQDTAAQLADMEQQKEDKISADADRAYFENKFASILDGSPKGVYATLSDLQEAYPDGITGIYVVQEDGNWYFYLDGFGWTSGGDYQQTAIGDEMVTVEKTDFNPVTDAYVSKNIFNKAKVTNDYYVQFDTGFIVPTSQTGVFSVSDFIKIVGDRDYSRTYTGQIAFYDLAKNYISGIGDPNGLIHTPSNAHFMKMTVETANLTTCMVNEGADLLSYEPFGNFASEENLKGDLQDKINSIKDKVSFPFIHNIIDDVSLINGQYVRWDQGTLGTNTSYSVTDYVPVLPNSKYIALFYNQIAFYDASKTYISGIGVTDSSISKTFSTPSNAAFARFTILNTDIGLFRVQKNVFPSFSADPDFLTQPVRKISDILSRLLFSSGGTPVNIKLIGDSRTAGLGGTGYATTGEIIYGSYQVNENGTCWANLLKTYLESKFNCVVKNYGVSGKNTRDISQNISTIIHGDEDIVICDLGTNDRNTNVNLSLTEEFTNLMKVYNYIHSIGAEIIFMSTFPASTAAEDPSTESYHLEDVDINISKLNKFINQEHISLFRLVRRYCLYSGQTWDGLLGDGLHPNDNGYAALFKIILDALGLPLKNDGATW